MYDATEEVGACGLLHHNNVALYHILMNYTNMQ
jgi:hypothetical protein